jgi:peptidoglycan/xylan/chitin deacetylase (PgdA/CDA1 family)
MVVTLDAKKIVELIVEIRMRLKARSRSLPLLGWRALSSARHTRYFFAAALIFLLPITASSDPVREQKNHGAPTEAVVANEPAALPSGNCSDPDLLNTSRTIKVGVPGALQLGLKSYPQTLDLADHEVVLTFDDGPLPPTTGKVLDALRRECVRATFFLIGRNAEANPQLVRQEIREGHSVGHHSWSHPAITLRGLSEEAARQEVMKGIAADERAGYGAEATPDTPHVPFFRFPGFADTGPTLNFLASKHIAVFGADLWASDWLMLTPQAELNLVLSRLDQARRGIILFHDTRGSTVAMLPSFLRELKRRGYKVVHLEPGTNRPALYKAPDGWTSETEAIVSRVLPKLLARNKPEGRRVEPGHGSRKQPPQAQENSSSGGM